jgi:hypothetical protein
MRRRSAEPVRPDNRKRMVNRECAKPGSVFARPEAASDVNSTAARKQPPANPSPANRTQLSACECPSLKGVGSE